MFLTKKNAKKDQCKVSLESYFLTAENAVVLCKNLDTEGKIHFVVFVINKTTMKSVRKIFERVGN